MPSFDMHEIVEKNICEKCDKYVETKENRQQIIQVKSKTICHLEKFQRRQFCMSVVSYSNSITLNQ